MIPPGPTSAVVLLVPRLNATSPAPVGLQLVSGSVALTASGVALSSPDVLFAGVGSVIVVVPVTEKVGSVIEPSAVFEPSSVTCTFAGILFGPTDRRFKP